MVIHGRGYHLCWLYMAVFISFSVPIRSRSKSRMMKSGSLNAEQVETQSESRRQQSHSQNGDDEGFFENCAPCVCHDSTIDCSGQNLTTIPQHLPNSAKIENLNLSNNSLINNVADWSVCEKYSLLTTISFAFTGLAALPTQLTGCQNNLLDLTLTGNWLTVRESSAFQDLQSLRTLRGLWVKNQLPPAVFRHLSALTNLELTYQSPTIPDDLFAPLARLNDLWLALTQAKEWPSGFALPSNLKRLRLQGPKLKSLPSDFLHGVDGIKMLQIELPELMTLNWKTDDFNASHLEDLIVDGLSEVTSESIAMLTSLKSLTLKNIRTFTDMDFFKSLQGLRKLEINNCFLALDDFHWIKYLSSLTSLVLKNTQLQGIRPDLLSTLTGLKNLDLSYNQLKMIPENVFTNVSDTLEHLDLSGNLLRDPAITATVFPTMANLEILDLSSNRLTSLDLDIFASMPALSRLAVRENAIKRIVGDKTQSAEFGFTRLSSLDLSNNMLETIPDGVPLEKVSALDMSGNPLEQGLPIARLEVSKALVELDDTLIDCSCRTYKLVMLGALNGGVCKEGPLQTWGNRRTEELGEFCTVEGELITTTTTTSTTTIKLPTTQKNVEAVDEGVDDEVEITRTLTNVATTNTVLIVVSTDNGQETGVGSTDNSQETGVGSTDNDQETGVGSTDNGQESENASSGDHTAMGSEKPNYTTVPFEADQMSMDTKATDLTTTNNVYQIDNTISSSTSNTPLQDTVNARGIPIENVTIDQSHSPDESNSNILEKSNKPEYVEHDATVLTTVNPLEYNNNTNGQSNSTESYEQINATMSSTPGAFGVTKSSRQDYDDGQNELNLTNAVMFGHGLDDDTVNDSRSDLIQSLYLDLFNSSTPWQPRTYTTVNIDLFQEEVEISGGDGDSEQDDASSSYSAGFTTLPWIITLALLGVDLAIVLFVICRRRSRRGSHNLADGNESKGNVAQDDKLELMELGIASQGGMPVIM